jgi:hypothetical protein
VLLAGLGDGRRRALRVLPRCLRLLALLVQLRLQLLQLPVTQLQLRGQRVELLRLALRSGGSVAAASTAALPCSGPGICTCLQYSSGTAPASQQVHLPQPGPAPPAHLHAALELGDAHVPRVQPLLVALHHPVHLGQRRVAQRAGAAAAQRRAAQVQVVRRAPL